MNRFSASLLTFFGFLLPSLPALGQGTVRFLNDSDTLSSPPDRLIRFAYADSPGNILGTNLAPAIGTNYLVQLYYGASTAAETSLLAVTSAPARLRASLSALATGRLGVWTAGGTRTLDFPYGELVELQVRVWDSNFGQTYDEASANARAWNSAPFLYQMPSSFAAPLFEFAMANFNGFTIGTPEPSVSVLLAFALVVVKRAAKPKPHAKAAKVAKK